MTGINGAFGKAACSTYVWLLQTLMLL